MLGVKFLPLLFCSFVSVGILVVGCKACVEGAFTA